MRPYKSLARLAARLRRTAVRERDGGLRRMYSDDARRVEAILRGIEHGRAARVRSLVMDSDTALRDAMPVRLVSWAWTGGGR